MGNGRPGGSLASPDGWGHYLGSWTNRELGSWLIRKRWISPSTGARNGGSRLPGRARGSILSAVNQPAPPGAESASPPAARAEHGRPPLPRRAVILVGSFLVWVVIVTLVILWTPLVFLVFVFTAPWDRRRRIVGRVFRLLAYLSVRVNPFWRVRIHGNLPEPRDRAYVVVSNHESMADVMIIGGLPWEMKWLSKRAIGRIPCQGWMMRMAGDVFVQRRDEESRAEAFEKLRRWLLCGSPVMIFPEGTRSPTGEMLPFRNGAFRLAIETGAPVLPMAISGTRDALRKGSLAFWPARPRLAILDPVPVEGLGPEDIEPLREKVRALIQEARNHLRA